MLSCSSGMAGGGAFGKVAGITPVTMTGVGFTMTGFQASISMWTPVGGGTTETAVGAGTDGTMSGFHIGGFDGTGIPGTGTDTGKGREAGVFRTINTVIPTKGRN